jgi:hypothetical protein
LGLSAEFNAPTLNGRAALLAEKNVLLKGKPSARTPAVSESQVVIWVNQWWGNHKIQQYLAGWETYTMECEAFLGKIVSRITAQAVNIADLAVQMSSSLVQALAQRILSPLAGLLSLFASLSQGLN